jgi:hypothetical protein
MNSFDNHFPAVFGRRGPKVLGPRAALLLGKRAGKLGQPLLPNQLDSHGQVPAPTSKELHSIRSNAELVSKACAAVACERNAVLADELRARAADLVQRHDAGHAVGPGYVGRLQRALGRWQDAVQGDAVRAQAAVSAANQAIDAYWRGVTGRHVRLLRIAKGLERPPRVRRGREVEYLDLSQWVPRSVELERCWVNPVELLRLPMPSPDDPLRHQYGVLTRALEILSHRLAPGEGT